MIKYDGDILLIDDAIEFCEAIGHKFFRENLSFSYCNSSNEYKTKFANNVYKITLIDVILGHKDNGMDLLPILPKKTTPILISGFIAATLGHHFFNERIKFIQKPIGEEDWNFIIKLASEKKI